MAKEDKELTLNLHAGEFEAFLYSPSKQFLGIIRNEIVLLDFQCKVAKSGKQGYYLIYNGEKYPINKTGRIENLPIPYLDDYLDFLLEF